MSLKSLGGEIGNYQFLYVAGAKETTARVNNRKTGAGNGTEAGMVLSAKMYQDVSCEAIRSRGFARCSDCPLSLSEAHEICGI